MCRPASSTLAAAERHDRIGGQTARAGAAHPLKAARFDGALTNPTQKSSTVFGDFKIPLATWLDTEAILHRLRGLTIGGTLLLVVP